MLRPKPLDFLVFSILSLVFLPGCASKNTKIWSELSSPDSGSPEAIGTYSAGCLAGATSMYPDGVGFHVMRISRKRFYGHPDLIQFITEVSKDVHQNKLGTLLVGDLAQARGGPSPSGHASHQTGLDVDIWFTTAEEYPGEQFSLSTRETLSAGKIVEQDKLDPNLWNKKKIKILQIFAQRPNVDRIFVTAAVKKDLCQRYDRFKKNKGWLSKIRPWFGHDDHFHVRLTCPKNSKTCYSSSDAILGTSCDQTLEWWFSEEAKAVKPSEKAKEPDLPKRCMDISKNS
ncbi:MAG: penicillin-insensitive murein endopeptidase [Bacteriovoracia bacterium]